MVDALGHCQVDRQTRFQPIGLCQLALSDATATRERPMQHLDAPAGGDSVISSDHSISTVSPGFLLRTADPLTLASTIRKLHMTRNSECGPGRSLDEWRRPDICWMQWPCAILKSNCRPEAARFAGYVTPDATDNRS